MFESFLTTTSSEGLSALGTREQRSYELITETLRERLGDAHAALFGEPVATEHGDSYDWYAPLPGKASRLDDLDEDAREAARRRLERLREDIRALAARIAASGDANDLRLSEALENALNVPGEDHVYVVQTDEGPQPVLTSWAWTGDARRSQRGVLTGVDPRRKTAAATVAAASAPEPARPRRRPPARLAWLPWLLGLGWLLLAAMLAWIVLLLIQPCAVRGPAWLSFCPAPPTMADAGRASTIALQDQVDQLERRLAIADRACQPLPPPPPPPPPPEPAVEPAPPPEPPRESAIDRRLRRAGATRGDLNFSLIWNGPYDLDLAVTCPTGAQIWFRRKKACNGRLDVDSNANRVINSPVENIYYNSPGDGVYRVQVTLYKKRGRAANTSFQLRIRDGERTRTLRGRLGRSGQTWTTTYNYAGQQ